MSIHTNLCKYSAFFFVELAKTNYVQQFLSTIFWADEVLLHNLLYNDYFYICLFKKVMYSISF